MRILSSLVVAAALASSTGARAQENFEIWPVLVNPFPSTGGGGIMIGGYAPVVVGGLCVTPFTATEPNGTVYRNSVEFVATPVQGGVLCDQGKWRSADGSASGTTPFRIFIKGGVVRRAPD
jgi:hypothetical protein